MPRIYLLSDNRLCTVKRPLRVENAPLRDSFLWAAFPNNCPLYFFIEDSLNQCSINNMK